jgi:hypothetical protein
MLVGSLVLSYRAAMMFHKNDRYLNSILSEWIIYGFPEENSRAG